MSERPRAEMTDSELIEACRLTPEERRWATALDSPTGCGAVVLVAVLVLYALNTAWRWALGGGLVWVALVSAAVVLTGTLYAWLVVRVGRRRRVYWEELRRRYADASVDDVERETREGGRRAAADAVVIVTGRALPAGGYWATRVWLWADGGGRVERRVLSPFVLIDERDRIRLGAGEAPLSPAEAARVRELARAEFGGHITDHVTDGAPARVVVWERGRGVTRRGSCNLAGVPERRRDDAMIRLMTFVEELGRRVEVPGLLVGSCDPAGNVRIGEM